LDSLRYRESGGHLFSSMQQAKGGDSRDQEILVSGPAKKGIIEIRHKRIPGLARMATGAFVLVVAGSSLGWFVMARSSSTIWRKAEISSFLQVLGRKGVISMRKELSFDDLRRKELLKTDIKWWAGLMVAICTYIILN
jgi:hypothetical protein